MLKKVSFYKRVYVVITYNDEYHYPEKIRVLTVYTGLVDGNVPYNINISDFTPLE